MLTFCNCNLLRYCDVAEGDAHINLAIKFLSCFTTYRAIMFLIKILQ